MDSQLTNLRQIVFVEAGLTHHAIIAPRLRAGTYLRGPHLALNDPSQWSVLLKNRLDEVRKWS